MISAHRHGAVVHLHAEGDDDADRRDMAAILAAYFEAEQARAFWRVLSKRLGAVALIALVFEAMTRLMSAIVVIGFFALVCGTGLVGAMVYWRAHRKLRRLVDEHSDTEHLRAGDGAQHTRGNH